MEGQSHNLNLLKAGVERALLYIFCTGPLTLFYDTDLCESSGQHRCVCCHARLKGVPLAQTMKFRGPNESEERTWTSSGGFFSGERFKKHDIDHRFGGYFRIFYCVGGHLNSDFFVFLKRSPLKNPPQGGPTEFYFGYYFICCLKDLFYQSRASEASEALVA